MLVFALLLRCEVPPNKFLDHSARIALISLTPAAVVLVLWSYATSRDSDFPGTVERIVVALVRAFFDLFRQPVPSATVLNVDANGGAAPPHGSRAAFATRIGWIIFGMLLVIGLQLSSLPMTQVLTAVGRWISPMAPFLTAFGAAAPHRSGGGAAPAAAQSAGTKACEADTCDAADGRGMPSFSLIVCFFFLLVVWICVPWDLQGVPAAATVPVHEANEESDEDEDNEEEDQDGGLNDQESHENVEEDEDGLNDDDEDNEEQDEDGLNEEFHGDEENEEQDEVGGLNEQNQVLAEDDDRGLNNNEQRLDVRVEQPPERDLAVRPPAGRMRRFVRRFLCCAGP